MPSVVQVVAGSATTVYGFGTTQISTQAGSWLALVAGWNCVTPAEYVPLPALNVTDSAGNLWQQAAMTLPGSVASVRCAAWVAPNAMPVSWVSAGLTGFAASMGWTVAEISGMPQAASVDFSVGTDSQSGTAPSLTWIASETGIGFAVVAAGNTPATAATPAGWTALGTAAAGSASTGCTVFGYLNTGITAGTTVTSVALGTAAAYAYALCSLSSTAAPPPQANLNFPGVIAEAAFDAQPGNISASTDYLFSPEYATWTDITARVIGPAVQGRIKAKRGRPYQLQQQETGTSVIPVSNVDGAFTPTNPGSPFYSNALNANMSFQSGITPWVPHAVAGVANVSVAQSNAAMYASGLNANAEYSMMVTVAAGTTTFPGAASEQFAINPNYEYTASAWFYRATGPLTCEMTVNWYTAVNGTQVGTLVGASVTGAQGAWTQITASGTVPPGGLVAKLVPQIAGTVTGHTTFFLAEAALVTGGGQVATGLVSPITPVRVTAWWQGRRYPVWMGYAQEWPQEWPDLPQWGFSTMKAADALGAAAAGQMQSALIGEVLIDNPYAYLPCNESYTTQVTGATPSQPFIFSGGYQQPADANGLAAINRATGNQISGTYLDGQDQQVSTGLAMNFLGDSGTGMGATGYQAGESGIRGPSMLYTDPGLSAELAFFPSIEFWFNYSGTAATQQVTLFTAYAQPSAYMSTNSGLGGQFAVNAAGSTLTATTIGAGATASTTIVPSGNPQHFALLLTGSPNGFQMYVNGQFAGQDPLPGASLNVNNIVLGPGRFSYDTNNTNIVAESYYGYNFAAGHLAVYPYLLSPARILAHYKAGATGWQGADGATRFGQILTWARLGLKRGGYNYATATGTPEVTQIGPAYQLSGQNAASAEFQLAQSEGGQYRTQANGSLVYLERDAGYNLPVTATFADGTAAASVVLNPNPDFNGNTVPWTVLNGSLAASTAQTYGSFGPSALLTPSGGTALSASIFSPQVSITPGGSYTAMAWVFSPAGYQNVLLGFDWYNGGTYSSTSAPFFPVAAGAWTCLTTVQAAPGSAVTAAELRIGEAFTPGTANTLFVAYGAMWSSPGFVPYDPKSSYGFDQTYLYNEVNGTQQDGPNQLVLYDARGTASQARYFRRSALTFTPNVVSAYDVSDITTWSLAQYQQPSLRSAVVTVDAASNPLVAFPVILQDLAGQVAQINRAPVGGAPLLETGTVQQVTHDIGAGYWKASYQASPYGPGQSVLCADTAGFDAPGTTPTLIMAW